MIEHSVPELVGYVYPIGRYPSPATPIVVNPDCQDHNDRYLAAYLDDNLKMETEPVHAQSKFIKLSATQQQKLKLENFDCCKHRLFAVSESILRFYRPQDEMWFFGGLLSDRWLWQMLPSYFTKRGISLLR
jgi:hypothetical protein